MTNLAAAATAAQKPSRSLETSEFIAMLYRQSAALRRRCANDPAGLVQALEFQARLANDINAAIYEANVGNDAYSMNEIAKMLGYSRQAIQQRVARGREWVTFIEQQAGSIRIADIRAARARLLAATGSVDRTGSERERATQAA